MLFDLSDFFHPCFSIFHTEIMYAVSPGTQIELFPKILRVRGYFQFFLNFFFFKKSFKKKSRKSWKLDWFACSRNSWNSVKWTPMHLCWRFMMKILEGTGESENITKVLRLEVNVCYKTSVREALGSRPKNGIKIWSLGEFGAEFKKFFHKKVGTVSALNVRVLNFTKKS